MPIQMMIMIIAAAPLAQATARREAESRGRLLTERVSTSARLTTGAGALTTGATGTGTTSGAATTGFGDRTRRVRRGTLGREQRIAQCVAALVEVLDAIGEFTGEVRRVLPQ